MSKLATQEKEVVDNYAEHEAFHQSFHNDCSECFRERRFINAFKNVNTKRLQEELGFDNRSALRNPHGDNYPLGYIPE